MTGESILVVIVVAIAGLAIGLYVGERGRRIAAERWAVNGRPDKTPKAVALQPAPEAEDRMAEFAAQVSEETVKRLTNDLAEAAREQGLPVDMAQLEREAKAMLEGGESFFEPSYGG